MKVVYLVVEREEIYIVFVCKFDYVHYRFAFRWLVVDVNVTVYPLAMSEKNEFG